MTSSSVSPNSINLLAQNTAIGNARSTRLSHASSASPRSTMLSTTSTPMRTAIQTLITDSAAFHAHAAHFRARVLRAGDPSRTVYAENM